MAEQAKIMTLHDHDTGEAIAPRTDVKALSGEGKKWNYVGFTEDDQIGLIEGTWPCNKNFLINSYFVGGGSQKGNGQFPINQRGKTELASVSRQIFIDKWYVLRSSWTLESEGLSGKKDDSGNVLPQGKWTGKRRGPCVGIGIKRSGAARAAPLQSLTGCAHGCRSG